jgi:hypothetical protein
MSHAVLESPILLFVIVFLPTFILLGRLKFDASLRGVFLLCGGLSVAAYVVVNMLNVFRPGVLWHDEAHILAVAATYLHGQPMYPPTTAPDFYALVYGPLTYLVYVPIFGSFHHPIPAMRIFLLAVNLANLALLFFILRERLSRPAALAILSVATALLLTQGPVLLGTRGDSWLLLFISLAILCALQRHWIAAAIATGVFGSLAVGFKPTVAPVLCLILAIVYRRHGLRALLASGATSVVCGLAVFLLPGISLPNYLNWLVLSGQRRLLPQNLIENLMAAAFLIVPCLLILLFGSRPFRHRRVGLVGPILSGVALAVCIATGSKDGAGTWHLWPMLPIFLLWTAYEGSLRGVGFNSSSSGSEESVLASHELMRTFKVVAAIAIAATVVTLRYGFRDIRVVHPPGQAQQRMAERAAEDAIDLLHRRSPSSHNLVMGYGADSADYRSNLRFELPLEKQDYFFDVNAVVEGIKEGVAIPQSVVQRILGCRDIWLIPHGQVPFSTLRTGVLPVTNTLYLFPDSIRLHFMQTHTLLESGEIYDLWSCTPVS